MAFEVPGTMGTPPSHTPDVLSKAPMVWYAPPLALTRLYIVLAAESFPLTSPLHDFFVERYESTRAMFRELVEKERAAGNLRPDVDPEQVSREILGAVLGFEMQWLMDPESFDYAETAEAYFDRLVRDLLIEP